MDAIIGLECAECGRTYPVDEMVYRCGRCDYPLEVRYDYAKVATMISKEKLRDRKWTMWRYRELLPIRDKSKIVSLDEGGTPLLRASRLSEALGLRNLYLIDETRNPTWSFKDRGTSVGVSKALEIGAKAVGCVSTGNMAASTAAYAAKAGIRGIVLIPSGTPMEKIVQMLICGAEVVAIRAPYPRIFEVALETSREHGMYMVHSDAPMRIEGQKTTSYEICERLGWESPNYVVIPTSSAGNISAQWKGWRELQEVGLVDALPAMVAIQAEGNAPIVKAFKGGRDYVEPTKEPKTIAHAIANPDPPSGRRALKILRESEGLAEAVSDREILEAQKLLAGTEGL
ncbi:MAG: threonine synthase, partial [Candidatus Bathyarchaeia archaeon]